MSGNQVPLAEHGGIHFPAYGVGRGIYNGALCPRCFAHHLLCLVQFEATSSFPLRYILSSTHLLISTLIMVATEMVHRGPSLVLQQSSTPPDSPNDTLDDEQAELASAIAAMKRPATTSESQCDCCSRRLSGSTASSQVELRRAKRFLDIPGLLRARDEIRTTESPARARYCYFCHYTSVSTITPGPPPLPPADEARQLPARNPELGFKTVNEMFVFLASSPVRKS